VARNNAKACAEKGVERSFSSVHHKSHVEKVMCIAVAALAFDGDVEDGGYGVKITFDRCQAAKVADKRQWEMHTDENGNRRANKNKAPLREAMDVWFVDSNVTGSDEGDCKNPKFSLKAYFQKKVVPILEKMIAPGEKFEGYTPILQGDNAPGHAEGGFTAWLKETFEAKGWHIENQAPQSPYTNVCDLAIFPCMAKRHTHRLIETHGYSIPDRDQVWTAAKEIWDELDSCTIARSFLQARRVHNIIVKDCGKQAWLSNGGPHCNCRRDFKDGDDRISVWPRTGARNNVDEYRPFREKISTRRCKSK
jgi:hypothetical protein